MPTQPSPIGNTVGPLAPSRRGGYVREVMPVDRGSLGRFRQERLAGHAVHAAPRGLRDAGERVARVRSPLLPEDSNFSRASLSTPRALTRFCGCFRLRTWLYF